MAKLLPSLLLLVPLLLSTFLPLLAVAGISLLLFMLTSQDSLLGLKSLPLPPSLLLLLSFQLIVFPTFLMFCCCWRPCYCWPLCCFWRLCYCWRPCCCCFIVVGIPSINVVSTSSYIPAVGVPLMFVFRTAGGPDVDVFLVLFFRLLIPIWLESLLLLPFLCLLMFLRQQGFSTQL